MRERNRQLIIAHRGYSARYPENSVEAFRAAWECGADGIETDVRPTADGVLVLHHDADIRLKSGARRRISELTHGELIAWAQRCPATLMDCFDVAPPARLYRGECIVLEVKTDDPNVDAIAVAESCVRIASAYRVSPWTIVTAGKEDVVEAAVAMRTEVINGHDVYRSCQAQRMAIGFTAYKRTILRRFLTLMFEDPWLFLGYGTGVEFLSVPASPLLRPRVGTFSDQLHLVYTVNDPWLARRLFAEGVAGIFTDDPELMVNAHDWWQLF